jgi:hypothetical protein
VRTHNAHENVIAKGVPHWLDTWRWAEHDGPPWWNMFPRYLAKL